MKEFFEGLQGLGFWQWCGLILLASALRGGAWFKMRRTS